MAAKMIAGNLNLSLMYLCAVVRRENKKVVSIPKEVWNVDFSYEEIIKNL